MSETDVDQVDEEIDAELGAIIDPLVEKVATLSEEIKTAETMVSLMKKKRQRYIGVIRSISPEKAPSLYANRKSSTNGKKKSAPAATTRISDEKLSQVIEWMQEHREEINAAGGIRAIDVAARDDFDLLSASTSVNRAFQLLHAQGIIRLDRREWGPASGKAGKYFKVV